jgi:rRNA-processing protein FCF1
MSIQLSKIVKELNIGISIAVEFLHKKGYTIPSDPNYKLTDLEEGILCQGFNQGEKLGIVSEKTENYRTVEKIDLSSINLQTRPIRKTTADNFKKLQQQKIEQNFRLDFEIYKSIQQEKKLTEIYLGSVSFPWSYAVADYTADCTEAIVFTPFDKVICGLLAIDNVLNLEEIAAILGLNIIDNPTNNQYRDIAEYEILVESLTSLYDFGMIEKSDSYFSRCRLTEIGKEYATIGKKFKTTENRKFKLYFDITANIHEKAKEVFQDIKPDSKTLTINLDYFSDENYLKTFAEKQIPEIYSPEYGNSFTNSYLNKITVHSVNLFAGVLFDFQLNTYRIKLYNQQIKSDYFTEKANATEELKATIIRSFFESLQPANFPKSGLQQQFEERTCEIQSDADYLLYQNKPQEAIEKISQYHRESEVIECQYFWQNIDTILDNGITEVFFNIPELFKTHYNVIQKVSKTRPDLKIFLAFGTTQIDTGKLFDNVFWKDNSPFQKFGCFTNDWFIFDFSYLVSYNNESYTTILLTKKLIDNSEKVKEWKKQFAEKYIPVLLEEFRQNLQNYFDASLSGIETIKNVDSKLYYFNKWFDKFGLTEYTILKQSQSELIERLQQQHKETLADRFENLKAETDIESIDKLEQINKAKASIKEIENECSAGYADLLGKVEKLQKELSEKESYIKDQLLAKHYIIDTNVFVDYPEILSMIDTKHNIVLSAKVVDELDKLKRKLKGDARENADKALKLINQKLGKKKGNLRTARADLKLLPVDFNDKSPDNLILCVALMYKDKNPFLITSDNGLQAKAKICEMPTLSLIQFLNAGKKNNKHTSNLSVNQENNIQLSDEILVSAFRIAKKPNEDYVVFNEFNAALTKLIKGFSCKSYGFNKFKDFCNSLQDIFEIGTNKNGINCLRLKE